MNKKENRGITLVALVITIIVLIILAGVSINAVMNGGLIFNAKNARDEYNKAKKDEEGKLSDLEADMQEFNIETPYKLKNGCITGIVVGETVNQFENKLPNGYGIYVYDDSRENLVPATQTDKVATGMVVKKDDIVIGHIVVFGDINRYGLADGEIFAGDMSQSIPFINGLEIDYDYMYVAVDVNHDGMLDWQDARIINLIAVNDAEESLIKQDVYADSKNNIKIESISQSRQNYVNGLSDKLKSKFELAENTNSYIVKGIESGATVGSLGLPTGSIVIRTNESNEIEKLSAGTPLQSGDQISLLKTYNGVELIFLIGQVE